MAETLTPQTANIPRATLAPVPTSEEIAFNHASPISSQVLVDAHNLGRMGLEGLSWQQGHNSYRVSAHDMINESQAEYIKTGFPIHKEGVAPVLGRRKILNPKQKRVDNPAWVVDKFNPNGDLIGTEILSAKELADQIDSTDVKYPSSPGSVSRIWWEDAPPKAPGDLAPADRDRKDIPKHLSDVFGSIAHHRELLDKPGEDWVGLTWTEKGAKLQVVKDNDMRVLTRDGTMLDRTYLIKKYQTINGDEKVVGFETFDAKQLKEHFNGLSPFLGEPIIKPAVIKDLHWEIPQPAVEPKIKTWAGRVALRTKAGIPIRPVRPAKDKDLIESLKLLNYNDVATNEESREVMDQILKDPINRKFVGSLGQAIVEYGPEGIRDLATFMRNSYLDAVDKLKLPKPSSDKLSTSWVLWEMAKQRYYAEHPDELDINNPSDKDHIDTYGVGSRLMPPNPFDMGSGPALEVRTSPWGLIDPFGDSVDAMKKRRDMIDREVGRTYAAAALVPQSSKAGKLEDDGTVSEQVITRYALHPHPENSLQGFVIKEVLDILNTVTGDDTKGPGDLTPYTLNRLGRLLRRQIIQ